MSLTHKGLTFNICIIGSGIGGASLASRLARKGITDIAVVEAGGNSGNAKDRVLVDETGDPFKLEPTRSIELGGTSNLWHGVLAPLDPMDFKKRHWIPNSGWPISYRDLEEYYISSGAELNLGTYDWFNLNNLSSQLNLDPSAMPIDFDLVENKIFQQPQPVLNFKEVLQSLSKQGQVRIFGNHIALELVSSYAGNISSVKVIDLEENKVKYLHARKFIIATGALESPRLLLNSNSIWQHSLKLKKELVGSFLMDHPMGNLMQVEFKKRIIAPLYSDYRASEKIKIKSGLVFKADFQEVKKIPNHNFYIRPSFIKGIDDESEKLKLYLLTLKRGNISPKKIAKILKRINVVKQILAYKLSLKVNYQFADIFFITEQIPNADSYVKLSDRLDRFGYPIAQVHWKLSEIDRISMRQMYRQILKIFPARSFKYTHSEGDIDWDKIYTSAAHHVGTLRMASNSNEGVVDKNLKVFGMENLYVCDGSVFPTSGNVNSGLTIAALAHRLADHIGQ
jgi:hypothetical protein